MWSTLSSWAHLQYWLRGDEAFLEIISKIITTYAKLKQLNAVVIVIEETKIDISGAG